MQVSTTFFAHWERRLSSHTLTFVSSPSLLSSPCHSVRFRFDQSRRLRSSQRDVQRHHPLQRHPQLRRKEVGFDPVSSL